MPTSVRANIIAMAMGRECKKTSETQRKETAETNHTQDKKLQTQKLDLLETRDTRGRRPNERYCALEKRIFGFHGRDFLPRRRDFDTCQLVNFDPFAVSNLATELPAT